MKICFLCNEYPPAPHGGIGTFVQVLARGLAAAGHEVRAVGMYNIPAAVEDRDGEVRVVRLPFPQYRLGWIAARYRLFRHVAQWARAGEIDLVSSPDYEGWIARWPKLPVPVVVRLHGSSTYFAAEMKQPIRWSTRYLERQALLRADTWCSVSEYTARKTKSLFKLPSDPRAILYNPIELSDNIPLSQRSSDQVVFTGTLTEKKGVVPLFRAWSDVARRHPTARLQVYGKDGRSPAGGSMREYLLELLEPAARPSVTFHGHQPRDVIFTALNQARLAVFPSYAEAFAIAPLEAMARGCPTIYSERGSGPELITHGHDGWLVDPDSPDAIASGIVKLLTDDSLAARLGTNGWQRIRDHFSLPAIVAENEAFYRECIEALAHHKNPRRTLAAATTL